MLYFFFYFLLRTLCSFNNFPFHNLSRRKLQVTIEFILKRSKEKEKKKKHSTYLFSSLSRRKEEHYQSRAPQQSNVLTQKKKHTQKIKYVQKTKHFYFHFHQSRHSSALYFTKFKTNDDAY